MNEIGGYLELELANGKNYHSTAVELNTGRNAFEYILRANKPVKIYIPKYTCQAMFDILKKMNIKYEFYNIDVNLDPKFDFNKLKRSELIIYNNYFGVKDTQCRKLSELCNQLVIDSAQAFYYKPINSISTFNSARKFFGVSDGAYLYTKEILNIDLQKDNSIHRMSHLHRRLQDSAKDGYLDYLKVEDELSNQPIKEMSLITSRILDGIDYDSVKNIRRSNYIYLHSELGALNTLDLPLDEVGVPMVYPLLLEKKIDRSKLAEQGIYLAKYWPNIEHWMEKNEFELSLTKNLLPLPIDQRYGTNDLDKLLETIKPFI